MKFVQGDILNLPFTDEEFGAVFCISTIEHIGLGFYQDPQSQAPADHKAMQEASRVLKKGGMLVLTVPYGIVIPNSHHRIYDADSLARLLSGLKITEERYFINVQNANGARNNFWQEVTQSRAAQVASGDLANGVCLIKAFK